jgi:small subunit ribosomal protein S14
MTTAWKARNKKRIDLVEKFAAKRKNLKETILDRSTSDEDRQVAVDALNKLPKNSSKGRIHLRCQLTGRSRGNYQKFKLSRHSFRELAHAGLIPGITKASW